jgi:hypothetical protein
MPDRGQPSTVSYSLHADGQERVLQTEAVLSSFLLSATFPIVYTGWDCEAVFRREIQGADLLKLNFFAPKCADTRLAANLERHGDYLVLSQNPCSGRNVGQLRDQNVDFSFK